MGDFRIIIEGVGNHGCGREAKDGQVVTRCGQSGCSDCAAIEAVNAVKRTASVTTAVVQHWPKPGAGCVRTGNPGPVDDLLTGVRHGQFGT